MRLRPVLLILAVLCSLCSSAAAQTKEPGLTLAWVGDIAYNSASGLPAGATFFDNGNNTGTFSWVPGFGQAGNYTVSFIGDNAAGNVETVYSAIKVIAVRPANDDIAAAIVIGDLPFTHTEKTTLATTAYDDSFCAGRGHSGGIRSRRRSTPASRSTRSAAITTRRCRCTAARAVR